MAPEGSIDLPGNPLILIPMGKQLALGIDIGGTNTQFGLVDPGGRLLASGKMPTGKEEVEGFIDRLHKAVLPLLSKAEEGALLGMGVGAPNVQPFTGEILQAANLPWEGNVPLKALLERKFSLPVVLHNDANVAVWGEYWFGAGRRFDHLVMITLGTGLGSGIIHEGRLLLGQEGLAGELGHWIVDPGGRPCGCGRRGCLERYVSATGLVETADQWLSSTKRPSVLREVDSPLTARRISEGAASGDELCRDIFDYTACILGGALANLVACLSTEAIFLFGGMAESGPLLFDPLRNYFEENLLYLYRGKVEILPSGLPSGEAAVLGAAALIWHSPLEGHPIRSNHRGAS